VRIVRAPPSMAALMAEADVALSAAGTTTLELACMGVPSVIVVVAGNQVLAARAYAEREMFAVAHAPNDAVDAFAALVDDVDARRRRSDVGRRAVDGRGAERVVAHMLKGATP
jgi:spore coat polysaccharide biosynthesis predicted glycosyltransferase SpsG